MALTIAPYSLSEIWRSDKEVLSHCFRRVRAVTKPGDLEATGVGGDEACCWRFGGDRGWRRPVEGTAIAVSMAIGAVLLHLSSSCAAVAVISISTSTEPKGLESHHMSSLSTGESVYSNSAVTRSAPGKRKREGSETQSRNMGSTSSNGTPNNHRISSEGEMGEELATTWRDSSSVVSDEWFFVGSSEVSGLSTSKGRRLKAGDEVNFTFPSNNSNITPSPGKFGGRGRPMTAYSEIFRFSTKECGEINNWAVPGTSTAPQVRSLRKVNNDQVAIAIDTLPGSDGKFEDEDDDKAHGFKSLTTSKIIPRFTRPVTDMVDGLWVSCERALMRQPALRLALIMYWAILHALVASLVV